MTDASTLTIDQLVERTGSLYSLPAVAMEVLDLTNHPKVDTAKLKACIERDPALTTKILKVVNSSLFGLSRQVSDLNQALALLGTKPLKLLVLGFSLPDALFAELAGDVLDRYWQRTLTRAVAARELAEQVWKVPGDEAFIAGLLEDIGLLVMVQELGETYVGLLKRISSTGDYLRALEQHAIGFDHVALTGRLLERWGLPVALIDALEHEAAASDEDTEADAAPLPRIVHLADLLTRVLVDDRQDVFPIVVALGRKWRGLEAGQLKELAAELQEKVGQLADVLSLKLPEGVDYVDIVAAAHRKLADVACDAAGDLCRRAKLGAKLDSLKLLGEVQSLADEVSNFAERGRRSPASATPATPSNAAQERQTTQRPATGANRTRPNRHTETEPDAAFAGRLRAAVNAARQARCPLSLLLVELDHYADEAFQQGVDGAEGLLRQLASICRNADHAHVAAEQVAEARFGVLLLDCDRRQAVDVGNQLIDAARCLWSPVDGPGATVSVGAATVALPPRNFPPRDLVEAADRCLFGFQAHGGDAPKSIEIY